MMNFIHVLRSFYLLGWVLLLFVEQSKQEGDTETRIEEISHPGHLKRFGHSGPFLEVTEYESYPDTTTFFVNHVRTSQPAVMRNAGKLSRAFSLWSDEYLKSVTDQLPVESTFVNVEAAKKENRNGPTVHLGFKEFLGQYVDEPIYMVDAVPKYLRKDVVIPGPLQCKEIYQNLIVDMVMWMSSGGTSSVVHTDSVDNIICVLAGEKSLILVDPEKNKNKVELDHPQGAYSGIDVDRVDYIKYSGLVDVEYHRVNLSAGDCLYIPYMWIHQVRSYGRNIAVNVWWDHYRSMNVNIESCDLPFSSHVTLDLIQEQQFSLTGPLNALKYGYSLNLPLTLSNLITPYSVEHIQDHLRSFVFKELQLDEFIDSFLSGGSNEDNYHTDSDAELRDSIPEGLDPRLAMNEHEHPNEYFEEEFTLPLQQIFLTIDKNSDHKITPSELSLLSEKDWGVVRKQMERFDELMEEERRRDAIDEAIERKEYELKRKKTEL